MQNILESRAFLIHSGDKGLGILGEMCTLVQMLLLVCSVGRSVWLRTALCINRLRVLSLIEYGTLQ